MKCPKCEGGYLQLCHVRDIDHLQWKIQAQCFGCGYKQTVIISDSLKNRIGAEGVKQYVLGEIAKQIEMEAITNDKN